jgi:hypothetical protein
MSRSTQARAPASTTRRGNAGLWNLLSAGESSEGKRTQPIGAANRREYTLFLRCAHRAYLGSAVSSLTFCGFKGTAKRGPALHFHPLRATPSHASSVAPVVINDLPVDVDCAWLPDMAKAPRRLRRSSDVSSPLVRSSLFRPARRRPRGRPVSVWAHGGEQLRWCSAIVRRGLSAQISRSTIEQKSESRSGQCCAQLAGKKNAGTAPPVSASHMEIGGPGAASALDSGLPTARNPPRGHSQLSLR